MDAVVETTAVERDGASPTTLSRKVKAFVALTKPRVIELLLVVTAPTMILAQGGIPNLLLVLNVLIGGALSAGSAGAFNCYFDRDIDRIMNRTKNRPLVTGEISTGPRSSSRPRSASCRSSGSASRPTGSPRASRSPRS